MVKLHLTDERQLITALKRRVIKLFQQLGKLTH